MLIEDEMGGDWMSKGQRQEGIPQAHRRMKALKKLY